MPNAAQLATLASQYDEGHKRPMLSTQAPGNPRLPQLAKDCTWLCEKGAAPLFQRRRNTIYTFLCYLLVCKGGISISLVLALQNSTAQAQSTWPRTQWTLAVTANYKVLGCTSPNDNKRIVQLHLQICGTVFQPSCYLRAPYLCKGEVHGTSLISLIWVLIWERGPRTHLQFWDFTKQLLFASYEESNLFPKAQQKAELKLHLGRTRSLQTWQRLFHWRNHFQRR